MTVQYNDKYNKKNIPETKEFVAFLRIIKMILQFF